MENKDIEIEFSHYKNAITFPIENEKFITSYSANCFYSFQAKNADRHNTISEIEDEAVENKRVNKPRRCK